MTYLIKNRLVKLVNYYFWTLCEQLMSIGLPRLILFPIGVYFIGGERFGVFITAFSIISIIGTQPSNGLSTGLIRKFSNYSNDEQEILSISAIRLSARALSYIVFAMLLCILILLFSKRIPRDLLLCLIPLTISLYPENQFMLFLTDLRINRKFNYRVLWYATRGLILLISGVVGIKTKSVIYFSWGYSIGCYIPYFFIRFRRRQWFHRVSDLSMVSSLKNIWFHVSLSGIISLAGPYINRIILSLYCTYSDVSILFAAASTVNLYSIPISGCGVLLLSLLAKYHTIDDFKQQLNSNLIIVVFIMLVLALPISYMILGPFLLKILYPNLFYEAQKLVILTSLSLPFVSFIVLCRPIVLKYGKIKYVPILNVMSLTATITIAILLIPLKGTLGATWALIIGEAITGFFWMIACLQLFLSPAQNEVITKIYWKGRLALANYQSQQIIKIVKDLLTIKK
jgi:O-antigen/teichoic acid export membrane protein